MLAQCPQTTETKIHPSTIRAIRQCLGMTQQEFGERLGLSSSNGEKTVGRWERGDSSPRGRRLEALQRLRTTISAGRLSLRGEFRFIDLFAGVGGIRLPFEELGGECVFSSEWDKFAQQTYAANYGKLPHGDITQIAAEEIPSHEVLLAGFPCQAFSQAGLRKGFDDTRGTLFFEIQRILVHHQPSIVFLENVKQLVGHDKGRTLRTILSVLRGTGVDGAVGQLDLSDSVLDALDTPLNYAVDFKVLRARDFGVPQNRERVYIIGVNRNKVPNADEVLRKAFADLEDSHRASCLASVLEDNAKVDPKYTISDRLLAGHERRKKEHKRKGNGFGFSVFSHSDTYVNTISARYYKDGSEALVDQSDLGLNPRKLTPRECARLQGFPETFILDKVSDAQAYKQMGNSVAVPVIRALASRLIPAWIDEVSDRVEAAGEPVACQPSGRIVDQNQLELL